MPNAREYKSRTKSFLLIGKGGTGKTTQAQTLEGKGFAYLFDPNALEALAGVDCDYEEFVGDPINLNPASTNLKDKEASARSAPHVPIEEPMGYMRWLEHFTNARASDFFSKYAWVLFDSTTTFGMLAMNRQLWINARRGNVPHQDDYSPQMGLISGAYQNLIGHLRALGIPLLATAHETEKEDKRGIVRTTLLTTGALREQLPLFFSDVYQTYVEEGRFYARILKDADFPTIRCSFRHLTAARYGSVDLTIEDWDNPGNYGLGGLLRQAASAAQPQSQPQV